jgi:hypothetical protein
MAYYNNLKNKYVELKKFYIKLKQYGGSYDDKEYLSQTIYCDWKIKLYSPSPKKDYYIISVVYFALPVAGSKSERYIIGLTYIINNFMKVYKNFRLRIYHDNTTVNTIAKILESISDKNILNSIELFEYSIPFLRDSNPFYHRGFIGTMIRFFPLYNFPLHKVDKCVIFDIDNKLHGYYTNVLNFLNENNIDFAHRSRPSYIQERVQRLFPNGIKYPVIASFIYQSGTYDHSLISDFLEDTYVNNNNDTMIKSVGLADKYSYGIDEIYINKIHLSYVHKNKKKISAMINDYKLTSIIKKYFVYLNENQIKQYYWFVHDCLRYGNIFTNYNNGDITFTFDNETYTHKFDDKMFSDDKLKKKVNNIIRIMAKRNKLKKKFTKFLKKSLDKYKDYPYFFIVPRAIMMGFYINFFKINMITIKDATLLDTTDIVSPDNEIVTVLNY